MFKPLMLQKYLRKLELDASVQTEFPPSVHTTILITFSYVWVFYYLYMFLKSLDFHSADKAQLHPKCHINAEFIISPLTTVTKSF